MLGLVLTHAKAYRAAPAIAGIIGLCGVMAATGDRSVGLGGVPVRSLWFLLLGSSLFATLPLADSFDTLERTLVRVHLSRAMRACWHLAGTVGAMACATRYSAEAGLTAWFVCLSALALVSSAFRAESATLVLLAVGGGTILVDHTAPSYPISHVMASLGPDRAAMLYLLGLGLYVLGGGGGPVWRGGRSVRPRRSQGQLPG